MREGGGDCAESRSEWELLERAGCCGCCLLGTKGWRLADGRRCVRMLSRGRAQRGGAARRGGERRDGIERGRRNTARRVKQRREHGARWRRGERGGIERIFMFVRREERCVSRMRVLRCMLLRREQVSRAEVDRRRSGTLRVQVPLEQDRAAAATGPTSRRVGRGSKPQSKPCNWRQSHATTRRRGQSSCCGVARRRLHTLEAQSTRTRAAVGGASHAQSGKRCLRRYASVQVGIACARRSLGCFLRRVLLVLFFIVFVVEQVGYGPTGCNTRTRRAACRRMTAARNRLGREGQRRDGGGRRGRQGGKAAGALRHAGRWNGTVRVFRAREG